MYGRYGGDIAACRQSSCSGVRCISGSWYGARLAHLVRARVRVRVTLTLTLTLTWYGARLAHRSCVYM